MPLVTPQSHRAQRLLEDRGETVAVAESLTGGRLAVLLTEAPGSSATFLGGVVSYATEAKIDVLGVDRGLVERHGVVSAECARAMARGVRALMGATYGVSTTGVAGPDEQEGKPPGTVYVGVSGPTATRRSRWTWSAAGRRSRTGPVQRHCRRWLESSAWKKPVSGSVGQNTRQTFH